MQAFVSRMIMVGLTKEEALLLGTIRFRVEGLYREKLGIGRDVQLTTDQQAEIDGFAGIVFEKWGSISFSGIKSYEAALGTTLKGGLERDISAAAKKLELRVPSLRGRWRL